MKKSKRLIEILFFIMLFLFCGKKIYANAYVGSVDDVNLFGTRVFKIELDEKLVYCIDQGDNCATGYEYYNMQSDNKLSESQERWIAKAINTNYSAPFNFYIQNTSIQGIDFIKQLLIWKISDGTISIDDDQEQYINEIEKEIESERSCYEGSSDQDENVNTKAMNLVQEYYDDGRLSKGISDFCDTVNTVYFAKGFNYSYSIGIEFLRRVIITEDSTLYYYESDVTNSQRLVTTTYLDLPKKVTPQANYYLNDEIVDTIYGSKMNPDSTKNFNYNDTNVNFGTDENPIWMCYSAYYSGDTTKEANSDNDYTVEFRFYSYNVEVHHLVKKLNGSQEEYWDDYVQDKLALYVGLSDTDTLSGEYYYLNKSVEKPDETSISWDAEENLSYDNRKYKVTLNSSYGSQNITIKIYYTPGRLYVTRVNYDDKYSNIGDEERSCTSEYTSYNSQLLSKNWSTINIGESNQDSYNADADYGSYNFYNKYGDCGYVGYYRSEGSASGGASSKQLSIPYGNSDVHIYLYYEKRNIEYNFKYNGEDIPSIKEKYIASVKKLIDDFNANPFNYSDSLNVNAPTKLYYKKDEKTETYLKVNNINLEYYAKEMKLSNAYNKFNLRTSTLKDLSSGKITDISIDKVKHIASLNLKDVTQNSLIHAIMYKFNFDFNLEPSVKVYVRHMIKQSDGSYAQDNSFANENEIATCKELGFTSLQKVNNGYSERKTVYYAGDDLSNFSSLVKTVGLSGYSEYFEIDKADKLIINRSGTILKDGKIYNCDGYVRTYTNDRSFDNITKASQNYTSSSNLQITFENSSKNKIYIDYYYTPESYSEDSASTIGNNSNLNFTSYYNNGGGYQKFNNSTDSTVEGNTYVPSSEYLRPSIVAEICRPRNVKYTISTDGTNPTYDLNNYTAYAINSTSSNIIGTVNGITGSNDRNKVYELGNNTKVYLTDNGRANIQNVKNNSIDTLRNSSTTSQIFKSNNIKTTLGNITSSKTQKEDFSVQGDHKVGNTYLNGYRNPTGTTYYREYNLLNGASYDASNGTITDERADNVIIYTPAKIKEVKVKSSDDVVDHSEVNKNNVSVIQQNADFTITVNPEENGSYDTVYDAFKQIQKYITATYVAFDFDVKLLDSRTIWDKADNYTKKNVGAGTIVSAGSIIKLKDYEISTASKSVTAKFNAYSTSQETSTAVKASYGNMKVFASTKNQISEDYVISQIKQSSLKSSDSPSSKPYIDSGFIERRTTIYNQESGLESLIADASYACSKFQKTVALGRIFDFEITDCLDVNFKNVFRENVDNSAVNKQTGIAYYSGVRSLLLRDSIKAYNTNYYRARENTQRGYVSTILPLGPYKNTSNEYIEAPKLGYRIAYNVKTSGYYNPKETSEMVRSIKIVPSYYYISKTGDMSTYNDKIQIYYKNKSGKYVKFEGSDYSIGFKPNDGYRTLLTDDTTPNLDNLSINIQKLKISGEYTLDSNTMITTSDAGFIQSWYGEFKLPNSAIALAEDENGKVDINKPLTDGYIGVKFDIYCTDTYKDSATGESTVVTLSYNRNNKNDGRTNTTQWDYEGYMNYDVNNQNSFTNMRLRFEKGTLTIANNEDYQKIRGTVVFYDTDARAAEDFD